MKKFCFSLLLVFPILVFGQLRNADVYKLPEMGKENIRENINIPGFDGYDKKKAHASSFCSFSAYCVSSRFSVWFRGDFRQNYSHSQNGRVFQHQCGSYEQYSRPDAGVF